VGLPQRLRARCSGGPRSASRSFARRNQALRAPSSSWIRPNLAQEPLFRDDVVAYFEIRDRMPLPDSFWASAAALEAAGVIVIDENSEGSGVGFGRTAGDEGCFRHSRIAGKRSRPVSTIRCNALFGQQGCRAIASYDGHRLSPLSS
jgi:hypothetical protein